MAKIMMEPIIYDLGVGPEEIKKKYFEGPSLGKLKIIFKRPSQEEKNSNGISAKKKIIFDFFLSPYPLPQQIINGRSLN